MHRSKSASRNSSVTYAISIRRACWRKTRLRLLHTQITLIAFRDQLPPALPYPVIEAGGANEPIEATGSPADGLFVESALDMTPSVAKSVTHIEPSVSNIINQESRTPGINRGQGLWAEGGREPYLVEVS